MQDVCNEDPHRRITNRQSAWEPNVSVSSAMKASRHDRVWRPGLISLSLVIGKVDNAYVYEGNSFLPAGMYHNASPTFME